MNKTMKGALAAGAAGALLLGGAGSLAFWSDSSDVPGASITSGELKLGAPDCGDGWLLDGGAAYSTQLLVPGDTLTKTCTIDLTATGAHLGADLAIATPTWSAANGLTAELSPTATFTVNGATTDHVTSADDTGTGEISAELTVTFDGDTASNDSEDLTAALDAVTITATQTHDAPAGP
jgi:alternate signal-mediated exported protein